MAYMYEALLYVVGLACLKLFIRECVYDYACALSAAFGVALVP